MSKSALATTVALAVLASLAGCDTNPFAKAETPVPYPVGIPALPMNGLLVSPTGMTLYTFDKDTANAGSSACSGPCAEQWPPFAAQADVPPSGFFTLIKRDDGSPQWAYKGMPLYTYSKDVRTGDMMGNNYKSAWHVVKP